MRERVLANAKPVSLGTLVAFVTIAAGLSAAGTRIAADVGNTSPREHFQQLARADTALDRRLDRLERGYQTILYILCTQLKETAPTRVPPECNVPIREGP